MLFFYQLANQSVLENVPRIDIVRYALHYNIFPYLKQIS